MALFDQNRKDIHLAVERVWREIAQHADLSIKNAEVKITIEVTPAKRNRKKSKRKTAVDIQSKPLPVRSETGAWTTNGRWVEASTVLDVHADKPVKVRVHDGDPIWDRLMKGEPPA